MTAPSPVTIAHVLHHLVIGGMENGVVNLVNRLPRDRFRHAILCIEDYSDFARRIERDDVEIVALHRSQGSSWRLRWRLWQALRRIRPDVVHTRNLSGLDALLPAKLLGLRTLHSEHGFDVDNLQGRAARPALLRRLHAPLVDHYVCVSRDLAALMSGGWGIAPARIRQIYNGVDTDRFMPRAGGPREQLPFERGSQGLVVVGTVGRVRPIKDQATLLEAFARAGADDAALRERLRLVLVGDGPLLATLKERASALDIAERCWFAGARHDVDALMNGLDLFVLPSLNEGISNTVLEALACGIPVLASAVGGNLELVEDGVVGALFDPGDVPALAGHIERYARDEALRRQHGEAARRRVLQQFSLRAMLGAYQQVYEALADSR